MASSAPPPPPPTPVLVAPVPVKGAGSGEIMIISHSNLFYWWPVWAMGFLMALLTAIDGHRMILVPGDAEARRDWVVQSGPAQSSVREGVLLQVDAAGKSKGSLQPDKPDQPGGVLPKPHDPKLHMASSSSYGILWGTILLLVIFITNVPLRGLWSVVVIVIIVLMAVIFALADWWTVIFGWISLLDIRINMGGYLFVSLILFGMWLVVTMFFDQQIYMIFTPRQLKVCTEVGGGEVVIDMQGMMIEKHRDDLFRHWILGLGSGDLTVKTSGANPQVFHLHNVLFIGRKLQMIEALQKEQPVV
jgi:hypothetical protein